MAGINTGINTDLIDLQGDEDASRLVPSLDPPFTANGPAAAAVHPKHGARDSFAGLPDLMKARPSFINASQLVTGSANQRGDHHPRVTSGRQLAKSPLPLPLLENSPPTPLTCEPDYDPSKMRYLESLIAEIQAFPIDESPKPGLTTPPMSPPPYSTLPANSTLNDVHNSPSPLRCSHSAQVDNAVATLTPTVYDAMVTNINQLSKDNLPNNQGLADYQAQCIPASATTSLDKLQLDNRMLQEKLADSETKMQQYRWRCETNKGSKAAMSREMTQKNIEINRREMELDTTMARLIAAEKYAEQNNALSSQVSYLRSTLAVNDEVQVRAVQAAIDGKQQEIDRLKATIDQMEELSQRKDKNREGDQARRNQDLLDTLANREKLINSLQVKFAAEKSKYDDLEGKYEDVLRKIPKQNQVQTLTEQLREKSSEADRYRNQVHALNKALEVKQKAIDRLSDQGRILRGSAHLVKPASTTKLPKTVFPCIQCWVMNLDCDMSSNCKHCVESDKTCVRWKCSMAHVLKHCPDRPCDMVHDINGWLITREPRPQW